MRARGRLYSDAFAAQMALAMERATLVEAADRARREMEAEQLRSSLLSSVSHDLRTPLAVITGSTGALLEGGPTMGDATREDLLKTILEEAERLNRLIRNLLDMTRLESGAVKVLRASLANAGYHVVEAETGSDGLFEAATRTPDLILLDLGLPDLDGLVVTERLREWARMPIIVLSARGREEDKIIARLLRGMPSCPRIYFGVVEVRDVAALHLSAMTSPAAAGERFIASSGPALSMLEVAKILRERLPVASRRVPTRELPSWFVRVAARFDPELRTLLPLLDQKRDATSAKAERLLGWKARPAAEAIAASAESLLRFDLVSA